MSERFVPFTGNDSEPSHWDVNNVPHFKQIFDKDESRYDDEITRFEDVATHIEGSYMRHSKNHENKVEYAGACFGDEKSCEFITRAFTRIGTMSCVQLARHPIMNKQVPDKIIANKIYQYLDVINFTLFSNNIEYDKNTPIDAGFVMYSKYNEMMMIVSFGADVIVSKKSSNNAKKETTRYSNEYYFGQIENRDGKLYKRKGKMLRMKDLQTYHTPNEPIVTIIKTEPNYDYKILIAKHGSTSKVDLNNFSQTKDMKGLKGVLDYAFSSRHSYVTQIHERKVQYAKAIEDIIQLSKRKPNKREFPCIDNPREGCIYILSQTQYNNLKNIEERTDKPITIYGRDAYNSDNINNHKISKQIVKHRILDKPGMFKTFELTDDIMGKVRHLTQGEIVTFIRENIGLSITQQDFSFFMKVGETSDGKGRFIELNSVSDGTYNQIKLSFPELRKTFKLDTGKLDTKKLPRCDYKFIRVSDLIENYTELTDAYTGLVTGTRNIKEIDIYNSDEIKDALENSAAIDKLRQILREVNRNEEDIMVLKRVTTEKKDGFFTGKLSKLLLVISIIAAFHTLSKYIFGVGIDDAFMYLTGWNKEVYQTVDDVSKTAGNIVNGQKEKLCKLSAENLSKLSSEAAKTVTESRPDIAYETMKHQTSALKGLKFAWEKIGKMLTEGQIPEGVKYIGNAAPQQLESGKDVVLSAKDILMGPMNKIQTVVSTKLEQVAGGPVSANAIFEFKDGADIIRVTAKDIMGGSVNDIGEPIYTKIPGAMGSIILGYQKAMECTKSLITKNITGTSSQCNAEIYNAFQNQDQQMASLGCSWWNSLTGMSYLQMTTVVVGVGMVASLMGGVSVVGMSISALVRFFAARAVPSISRIGIHELKNLYETAEAMGLPILNTLKQQIINHPTETAQHIARQMGWI